MRMAFSPTPHVELRSWSKLDLVCMVMALLRNFGDGEMRRTVGAASLAVIFYCTAAYAENPTLLQRFQDWSAYGAADPKVCFIVAQPKDMSPKGVKRGPVYF